MMYSVSSELYLEVAARLAGPTSCIPKSIVLEADICIPLFQVFISFIIVLKDRKSVV